MRCILENELIPYEESSIPDGPYLIFAPHPDDETFGMGGTIAKAVHQGIDVHVVVLTDGGKGGDVIIRKKEASAAAELLGIKQMFFCELTDRSLFSARLPEKMLYEILDCVHPACIFLPSLQEFHPDHRGATQGISRWLTTCNYKGLIWLYEITRQGEVNRLVDISSFIDQKKSAVRCYHSQLSQLEYENVILAINKARSLTLPPHVNYAEGFWEVSRITKLSIDKTYMDHLGLYKIKE
ncbi:MAG: PIG-L family deacetylase [Desulfobacterales bacterium]|nr:PIG-L family deacetylase [Desulfobacterales bacterium]